MTTRRDFIKKQLQVPLLLPWALQYFLLGRMPEFLEPTIISIVR